MTEEFAFLPQVCFKSSLKDLELKPGSDWSNETVNRFRKMLDETLSCTVKSVTKDLHTIVLKDVKGNIVAEQLPECTKKSQRDDGNNRHSSGGSQIANNSFGHQSENNQRFQARDNDRSGGYQSGNTYLHCLLFSLYTITLRDV